MTASLPSPRLRATDTGGREPLPGHGLPEGPSCSLSSREAGAACQRTTSTQLFTRMNPHGTISTCFHADAQRVCRGHSGYWGPWEDPGFASAYRQGLQSLLTVNT